MKKILLLLLMLAMLPAAVQAETTLYIDGGSADRVHLRSAPSREADSLGLYYSGTPVTLLGMDVGWKQVRIGAETGWVMAAYLADEPKPMTGPIATVINPNDTWVNLREAASTQSPAVARVPTYDKVYILGETANGWHYISWRNQEGFMMSRFLDIQEEQAAIAPEAVGVTPDGQYIQRMIADNGQWLYFTSVEEHPPAKYEDVNFDGIPDIVVNTSIGASNFYTAFFVWDGDSYVYAENNGTDYGLVNYSLFPEYGIVMSQGSNGWAGALTETCLFRWEGTNLKILRRLISEELTETAFNQDTIVTTLWTEKLHVRIWDYRTGEEGGTLLYDRVFDMEAARDADWYEGIHDRLWQGIESMAYIQQYVVNTGKELRLISIREEKMEEEVLASLADMGASHGIPLDVNFDGIADRVHLTLTDEGEVTAVFDVCVDGQYVPVAQPLTAFQLYPRYGLVRSNGGTPEKRDTCLFRWDGTELTPIRRLVKEIDGSSVYVAVHDYRDNGDMLIYEQTMTVAESMTDERQDEMDSALWQGIR